MNPFSLVRTGMRVRWPLATATGWLAFAAIAMPLSSPFVSSACAEVGDKPLNAQKPLTIKEVCLLLRGGYTNDEVLAEVSSRRLLEPLDAPAEDQLTRSGATPAFLAALKAGNYNLSAADAAAARQKQAEIEQRQQAGRAAEARVAATNQAAAAAAATSKQAEADTLAVLKQAQRTGNQPLTPAKSPIMANQLRNNLVVLRGDRLQPYDNNLLTTKKIYGLYFSASWCGPCRKFTPSLVAFYDKIVALHPEFEIVLVCEDRSADAMQKYMQTDKMNWPAVNYASIKTLPGVTKYCGDGIPDLVLVDDSGQVLSDSYRNGQYVGPDMVVKDLMRYFASAK